MFYPFMQSLMQFHLSIIFQGFPMLFAIHYLHDISEVFPRVGSEELSIRVPIRCIIK